MNQATFIGNLTANAVQRATKDGANTYATFSVAVNRKRKDGAKETTYVDCVMSGKTAGVVPYLTKGKKVAVTGRVSCHAWLNRDGQPQAGLDLNVYELELVGGEQQSQQTAESNGGFAPPAPQQPAQQGGHQPAPQQAQLFPGNPQPDELPF